jgi:hypothetical protein
MLQRSRSVAVPASVASNLGSLVSHREGCELAIDACRLPLAPSLTPHGLPHSHKIEMDEMGTPQKLKDDRPLQAL